MTKERMIEIILGSGLFAAAAMQKCKDALELPAEYRKSYIDEHLSRMVEMLANDLSHDWRLSNDRQSDKALRG